MQATIQKWGNSLALRIPKSFALESQLTQYSIVELSLEDGKIVIAPFSKLYKLEELLSQITPENLHSEQDFGDPIGKEIW